MADVTYVISIRDDTSSDKSSKQSKNGIEPGGVATTPSGESGSSGKPLGKVIGLVAAKKVIQLESTYVSMVGARTGNVTRQEQLQYDISRTHRQIAIGGMIVGGIVTGNPLAVIAGVGAAVSWGIDLAIAQKNIDIQRSIEDISISQANIRAGAGGDRYGKSNF